MRAIRKVRITPIQAPRPIISLVLVQRKSLKMSPHRRKIVRRRNEPILITSILWFISPACWSLKETIITSFDEKEWKRNRQKIFYAFCLHFPVRFGGGRRVIEWLLKILFSSHKIIYWFFRFQWLPFFFLPSREVLHLFLS